MCRYNGHARNEEDSVPETNAEAEGEENRDICDGEAGGKEAGDVQGGADVDEGLGVAVVVESAGADSYDIEEEALNRADPGDG